MIFSGLLCISATPISQLGREEASDTVLRLFSAESHQGTGSNDESLQVHCDGQFRFEISWPDPNCQSSQMERAGSGKVVQVKMRDRSFCEEEEEEEKCLFPSQKAFRVEKWRRISAS